MCYLKSDRSDELDVVGEVVLQRVLILFRTPVVLSSLPHVDVDDPGEVRALLRAVAALVLEVPRLLEAELWLGLSDRRFIESAAALTQEFQGAGHRGTKLRLLLVRRYHANRVGYFWRGQVQRHLVRQVLLFIEAFRPTALRCRFWMLCLGQNGFGLNERGSVRHWLRPGRRPTRHLWGLRIILNVQSLFIW